MYQSTETPPNPSPQTVVQHQMAEGLRLAARGSLPMVGKQGDLQEGMGATPRPGMEPASISPKFRPSKVGGGCGLHKFTPHPSTSPRALPTQRSSAFSNTDLFKRTKDGIEMLTPRTVPTCQLLDPNLARIYFNCNLGCNV